MKRERKSEARWRRLIEEQERSGESVRAFAAARGLSAWSLYGWRSRLARRRLSERRARSLVPVEVVEAEGADAGHETAGIEIRIDERTVVRVPRGFDPAELVRVLEAVRRAC
jgi:hypothetical protein